MAVLCLQACTSTSPSPSPSPPTSAEETTPAATGSTGSTGEAPDVARLRPPAGGSFLIRGRYPFAPSVCARPDRPRLLARYPGTLEVQRADDGTLELTVTLAFEAYLQGI
ncbi:MAG TPA: hypothetical protein VFC08_07090, partial [Actinomycetota bacterium]|nr:hypothetical protein [Actinomycetota bacterium]